nr:hypothetical protein L203_04647 [Cryptococcus depauperatus CBS 7841]
MGLQRTPPQRANKTSPSSHPDIIASQSLPAGVSPFKPRNPNVVRSPTAFSTQPVPSSSSMPNLSPEEPEPTEKEEEPQEQEIEALSHKSLIVDERPIRPAPVITVQEESMNTEAVGLSLTTVAAAGQVVRGMDEHVSSAEQELASHTNYVETAQDPVTPPPLKGSTRSKPSHTRPSHPYQRKSLQLPPEQNKDPLTPARTPRSRQSVLPAPPAPLRTDDDEDTRKALEWGKRYQLTAETVERAIKAGAQRWKAEHLKGCFPKMASQIPKAMDNAWLSSSKSLRDNISNISHLMTHYKAGASLQAIETIYAEAIENGQNNLLATDGKLHITRRERWSPGLSPKAIEAAHNMSIYDEAWGRLREEYLELHKDCQIRVAALLSKQAILAELEANMGGGIEELDETMKALSSLPLEGLSVWTEAAETKLEGRVPERSD